MKVNLFSFITWPLSIYLCYIGKVDWWVLLIIFLSTIKLDISYKF